MMICKSLLECDSFLRENDIELKKIQKNFIDIDLERQHKIKSRKIEWSKKYYFFNRSKIIERTLNHRKNNINAMLRHRLSNRIYLTLRKNKKHYRTIKLLGCSIYELKKHLENQFKVGMNWKNYGEWHIDHIVQCFKFNLTKKEEQLKCFHYTNLRPLWAKENLSRGKKDG